MWTRPLGAHRVPIHEACDGTDAVAACQAHCYHVIIMDIHMPTLNGFGHVPRDQIVGWGLVGDRWRLRTTWSQVFFDVVFPLFYLFIFALLRTRKKTPPPSFLFNPQIIRSYR